MLFLLFNPILLLASKVVYTLSYFIPKLIQIGSFSISMLKHFDLFDCWVKLEREIDERNDWS